MTAVVKNSILNPLATCFVPSSLKAFYGDKTIVALRTVTNEMNADVNSNDTKSTRRMNPLQPVTDVARMKSKYSDEKSCEKLGNMLKKNRQNSIAVVLFRLPSLAPESFPIVAQTGLGLTSLLLLNMLELIPKQNRNGNKYAAISEVEETEELEIDVDECPCPPVFGWVVPPTFFGNPLNIKYDCNKNYVHSPKYFGEITETCIRTNQSLKNRISASVHLSEEKETLEQCSLEFQMIIRDVCDSVRDENPSELEEKGQDCPEFSDKFQSEVNEVGKTVWNDAPNKTSNDEQIFDDGSHPLLQSPPKFPNEDEEARESIEMVENILGKCLLPTREFQAVDIESPMTKAVCNPPCSVWCESLPPAAKDAYQRFLKSRRHTESNGTALNPVGRRPSYKRSFSAGDAPVYAVPNLDFTSLTSEEESKERLLLLRKNSSAYFRNHALSDKTRHRASYSDISNRQLRESCLSAESNETSWGPFDGADSLWKPLPDCMPSNDCNQKPSHKKAREVKRQRSLN